MCVEGKHYANINIYIKTPRECLNLPLKQMNTEIGKVRTMRIIDPSVASTSMAPPRFPSADLGLMGERKRIHDEVNFQFVAPTFFVHIN